MPGVGVCLLHERLEGVPGVLLLPACLENPCLVTYHLTLPITKCLQYTALTLVG